MSRARTYDEQFAKALPLDWEKSVLETCAKKGNSVVDVGCGTGRLLSQLSGKDLDLTGVDLDKEFAQAARDKLRKARVSAGLMVADARSLPFKEESFDFVFSTGNILGEINVHTKDRRLMLAQMARVTRSNGTMMIEFVHRYWNPKDLLSWLRNYLVTAWKKLCGESIEFGDYTERFCTDDHQFSLTFHAFTTKEAERLFRCQRLMCRIVKRGSFFHDWFFVIGTKSTETSERKEIGLHGEGRH